MYSPKRRMRLFRHPAFSGLTTYDTLTVSQSPSGNGDSYITKYTTAGRVAWVTSIGGANQVDSIRSIITDTTGNVYVTGFYSATTLTFFNADGSPSTVSLTSSGQDSIRTDVFLAKYSSLGKAQWATRITGGLTESGIKVVTDSLGNVYITGTYTSSSITIYDAPGTASTLSALTNPSGTTDTFLVKYNSNGIGVWAAKIATDPSEPTQGEDVVLGMTVDSANNIYLVGRSTSTVLNAYNSTGSIGLQIYLNFDETQYGFIIKYNSDGIGQWSTSITGNNVKIINDVAVDSNNNVCVAGSYTSTNIAFPNADGGITLTSISGSASVTNGFIVKYNSDGTGQWRAKLQSDIRVEPNRITTDTSNNVYLLSFDLSITLTILNPNGTSGGTLGGGNSDRVVLVKYNATGTVQWRAYLDGTSIGADKGGGLVTDSLGDIYVTGTYLADLGVYSKDVAPSFLLPTTVGSTDVFICKFNTQGTAQWAARITGTSTEELPAIAIYNTDNVLYTAGGFASSVLTARSVGF